MVKGINRGIKAMISTHSEQRTYTAAYVGKKDFLSYLSYILLFLSSSSPNRSGRCHKSSTMDTTARDGCCRVYIHAHFSMNKPWKSKPIFCLAGQTHFIAEIVFSIGIFKSRPIWHRDTLATDDFIAKKKQSRTEGNISCLNNVLWSAPNLGNPFSTTQNCFWPKNSRENPRAQHGKCCSHATIHKEKP